MGCCVCFLLYAIIPVILGFLFLRRRKSSPVPSIEEKWWAPGTPTEEDTSVKPFKIEASDEVRLCRQNPFNYCKLVLI